MNDGIRQFELELYEEHLEEASFLYEQRRALLQDPTISWLDLQAFEERRDAHLDALATGGQTADEVLANADTTDSGGVNAALSLFCRLNKWPQLHTLLSKVDWEDEDIIRAAADALALEYPCKRLPALLEESEKNPAMTPMLLRLIGRLRAKEGQTYLQNMQQNAPSGAELIYASQRLGGPSSQKWLRDKINEEDPRLEQAALLAFLQSGDSETKKRLLMQLKLESWNLIPFALAGDQQKASLLMAYASSSGQLDGNTLLALGLSGDINAIPMLINFLAVEEISVAAALSLNLITGANLYEEVFIPEEIDEHELFEEELAQVNAGKPITKEDGSLYGETVVRSNTNPNTWQAWRQEHQQYFQSTCRYRLGKPITPLVLVENLLQPMWPNHIRQLVVSELRIRYNIDLQLEPEMPVAQQRQILQQQQAEPEMQTWEPGGWYLDGELQHR